MTQVHAEKPTDEQHYSGENGALDRLAATRRSEETQGLLDLSDDLLAEIDSVLEGCELVAEEYIQKGGE